MRRKYNRYEKISGPIRFHSAEYRHRLVEMGLLAWWDDGSSEAREVHADQVEKERCSKVRHSSINEILSAIDKKEKERFNTLMAKSKIVCNPWIR